MKYYLFQIREKADLEEVEAELKRKGLIDSFLIEDDATRETWIGGHSAKKITSKNAILIEERKAEVDWSEQWALFAENFSDGKAHIQVEDKTLLLTPGAGFGDLSHPTTYLMLEMMKGKVRGESVIDIGTGSGILALSALLLGAKSAIGIDIDSAALKHAKENAKLNQLKASFTKALPKKLGSGNVMLMNMIIPEQREFGPDRLNRFAKRWIVSGILESQKKEYLQQAKKWGWRLESEHTRLGWCGCIFTLRLNRI